MDFAIGLLPLGTIGAVLAFGYISARATERRRAAGGEKSTLAADAPSTRTAPIAAE
ncbi:MAG: hypothetical protein AAFY59_14830 [Pseudomonadota bacterium]